MEAVIQLKHVSQGYGSSRVINDMSIDIGTGVVGLLGPNGAGKTTLIRTFATLLAPQRGTLLIGGRPIASAKAARTARLSLGYLPQEFGFYPSFTVLEFLQYCAWLRKIEARDRKREAYRVVELVGLRSKQDTRLKTLSGGMIRRLGIGQALLGKPKLLLLDEPTVGLDPEQRLDFRRIIRGLKDTCVVLSTHLVEDVAAVCDEVIIVNDGSIIFRDSPDVLARQSGPEIGSDSALEHGYISVLRKRSRHD